MRKAVWDEMVTAQRSGLVQALGVANFDNEALLGSLIPPPKFLQVPIARTVDAFVFQTAFWLRYQPTSPPQPRRAPSPSAPLRPLNVAGGVPSVSSQRVIAPLLP